MADLSLTELFLNEMTTYGPLSLGLAMLLGPLGVPVPTPLLVLATGALARQGLFLWTTALVVALLGSVLGNAAVYAIRHFAAGWAQHRFGASSAWQKACDRFKKSGGLAIYATHFLFTLLGMHVNLIAGGSGYPYWRFLVFDVAGTLSWLMLYGGLGYVLGSQAEVVSQAIASYSGWLVGAVLVGIAVYLLVRHLRQPKRADAVSTCAAERA